MASFNDDLSELLAPPAEGTGLRYSQGVLVGWDAGTFENSVLWDGVVLQDLPVLSGPDALTYQAGDVVALLGWNPSGGTASWWIMGRVINPGPGAGAAAVDFLTSALASAISAQVFAARVKSDAVATFDTGAPAAPNWGNLPSIGPTVTGNEVTEAGEMVVFISGRIDLPIGGFEQAFMSIQVTGPTAVGPSFDRSLHFGESQDQGPGSMNIRATSAQLLTGLVPGTYTVQAKYQGSSAFFRDRELVVIAL